MPGVLPEGLPARIGARDRVPGSPARTPRRGRGTPSSMGSSGGGAGAERRAVRLDHRFTIYSRRRRRRRRRCLRGSVEPLRRRRARGTHHRLAVTTGGAPRPSRRWGRRDRESEGNRRHLARGRGRGTLRPMRDLSRINRRAEDQVRKVPCTTRKPRAARDRRFTFYISGKAVLDEKSRVSVRRARHTYVCLALLGPSENRTLLDGGKFAREEQSTDTIRRRCETGCAPSSWQCWPWRFAAAAPNPRFA
jgi:hypothetical protein